MNQGDAMQYHEYADLLENNRRWVEARTAVDPGYFRRLAEGQSPPFLFIGCSDSRKPLNTLTQTEPGELFIHRNVGNQVRSDDRNVGAVLEFSVDVLRVRHVIVCGHTRCGGMGAALRGEADGAVGTWIEPVRELYARHREEVDEGADEAARADRLAELNVVAQVENVLRSDAMQAALGRDQAPELHGWMFRVETGLIQELDLPRERWRAEGWLPGSA